MNKDNAVDVLNRYMDGKDNVKPDTLLKTFSEDGEVTFEIKPTNISFPEILKGNKTISTEMFGDFHHAFEKVKSFYLDQDFKELNEQRVTNQHWLVSMKERETGKTRIGTGQYHWQFETSETQGWVVKHVHIVIAHMISFDDESNWLERVQETLTDYPWADKEVVINCLAERPELKTVSQYLAS